MCVRVCVFVFVCVCVCDCVLIRLDGYWGNGVVVHCKGILGLCSRHCTPSLLQLYFLKCTFKQPKKIIFAVERCVF